jgi:predicted AlkP superfamily pyrophosphatase or phosphodiesterase
MRILVTAFVAMLSMACGKAHFVFAPTDPTVPFPAAPQTSVTRNVVLVSIDGLRPDAIARFKAPILTKLMNEGSYTLAASTILPSKTLPSHTSMLTGEPPDRHGILWNTAFDDAPGTIEIPTIFSTARSNGYRTAAFFSKAKFSHLQVPGTLDYSQSPGGWFGRWSAARTVTDIERHLACNRPNLLFVHLTDPDVAGHAHGWMSQNYGRGVLSADLAVGRLLAAADSAYGVGNYTIIVTADHGGNGNDHGSNNPLDVTIPWIAWGRGVAPGEIVSTVSTMDTASTVLFLLGLEKPSGWVGVPVRSAFTVAAND